MASFEKINYGHRPAKNIERKMICDALRRLAPFGKVSSYRYAGFGAIYFTDFALFHKMLGIEDMVSIEHEIDQQERVRANRPYKCIACEFGESTTVLSNPNFWGGRIILWLDYDWQLYRSHFSDIQSFCANAKTGSVLIVTVQAESELRNDPKLNALDKLRERVGDDVIPVSVTEDKNLAGWGLAKTSREIINNTIMRSINDRNGGLSPSAHLAYQQIFNFHYNDGARMLTVGGVLTDVGQTHTLASCGFSDLDFYRPNAQPFLIPVPKLTYREIRQINEALPYQGDDDFSMPPIPDNDVRDYAKIYRYFPNYVDADF